MMIAEIEGASMPADRRIAAVAVPTMPGLIAAVAAAYGDADAIRKDGAGLSYIELERRSALLARGLLARGVGKGTRVGLLMPNGPDWLVAWLAINRVGGLAVLISTFFVGPELAYAIRHADVAILLGAGRHLRHDYLARLEEALPGLEGCEGAHPLALQAAPFLREIWLSGEQARWSSGSLANLEALGGASSVFGAALLEAVEAAVSPADLGILMYTSGSTAAPKGVVHTQGVVVRKAAFLAQGGGIMPYGTVRGDRMVLNNPMFWVGGLLSMTSALLLGATLICEDERSPKGLLEVVRKEKVTQITGSESALRTLRDSPYAEDHDLERLRPQNTNQLPFFWTEVPRERLVLALGMTETCGPHSGLNDGGLGPPDAPNTVGPALDGVEYKILDPDTGHVLPRGEFGELYVRTPWLMDGMYKKERCEVFDADGFYATGDRCMLREDGYLFFDTRLGGMIKTSGANVSPEEVETAMLGEPDVLEAAVLGLPDDKLGQIVVAAVVRKAGAPADEAGLKARLRSRLSSFKVPKLIFFFETDDLPRTPSNKIRKPQLAEMLLSRVGKTAAGQDRA
jgi:acyl-CoA synthetase (AMP-forming)/AMP-acid ligase II